MSKEDHQLTKLCHVTLLDYPIPHSGIILPDTIGIFLKKVGIAFRLHLGYRIPIVGRISAVSEGETWRSVGDCSCWQRSCCSLLRGACKE
jgi:hypothetical protein